MSHLGFYGCWLFFLGCAVLGVSGQNTPFEVPDYVWWRGNAITFHKYRSDGGNCRQLALNSSVPNYDSLNGYGFNQNGAWFGGLDKITFKLDGTSCIRASTHRGEWVGIFWQQGQGGCSINNSPVGMPEIRYYNHPECRLNEYQNRLDMMEVGQQIMGDGSICFIDRGTQYVYYRPFCDVAPPKTTVINPITTTTVVHNVTNFVINNHTTFVPTIVKPEDLIPIVQKLMSQNASIFRVLSNTPSPSPPIAVVGTPNQQKSSASASEMDGLVAFGLLWGLLFAAVFCA